MHLTMSIAHPYQIIKYVAVNATPMCHINFTKDNLTRKMVSLVHRLDHKFHQPSFRLISDMVHLKL